MAYSDPESMETPAAPSLADEHDVMIDQLDTSIDKLLQKVESGRIADPDTDTAGDPDSDEDV